MTGRLFAPQNPVTLTLDGARIVADRGEPVAAALIAAGKLNLARSPKFHRPRGPACMRGACDGCLARVDGVANVMTCLIAAKEGLEVTSQNTLGSRELDLLRMTDWFFSDGMNHHELFAGVPGVQTAMQLFARRVAGLGRLPDSVAGVAAARERRPAQRRDVDVLVVGAGPAGMAAAVAVSRQGRAVLVVDDAFASGGGTHGLRPRLPGESPGEAPGERDVGLAALSLTRAFENAVRKGGIQVRSRTVAAGVYGRDVLVVGGLADGTHGVDGVDGLGGQAEVLTVKACILATGAHDGVLPFENNDLPGVMSARAACFLAASGASVGKNVVLLLPRGLGDAASGRPSAHAEAYEAVARSSGTKVTRVDAVRRVKGSSRVRGVVIPDGASERALPADALLVDAPRAPAYELCEQFGARLEHRSSGYVPITDRGRIADGVWAIGEVTGAPLSADGFELAAEEIASQL